MLGIDRHAAKSVWTAALVALALLLVYAMRTTLFVFAVALLFAYLLSPLVNLLDRLLPASRTRTPALALAYAIFVGIVVVVGAQVGSRVAEEANTLSKRLPEMAQQWEQPTPGASPAVNSFKMQVLSRVRAEISEQGGSLLSALPQAGMRVLAAASNLIYVVIVPVLAFFFLQDTSLIREHVLGLAEEGPRRAMLEDLMADAHLLLAHYMRALVILSLATFTAYSIFFSIMGVPYGVLLAALAFLLEFIPTLGPLTAALAIVLVAALSQSHVVAVVVFLVAYRMFQDYVLSPHLMRRGVELHPLLVLFGVFAGAEVAGVPGAFLSVPALALGRVVYLRMRKARANATIYSADNQKSRG